MKNKHSSKTADVNPNSNIVTATAAWRAQNQTERTVQPCVRAGRQSQLLEEREGCLVFTLLSVFTLPHLFKSPGHVSIDLL